MDRLFRRSLEGIFFVILSLFMISLNSCISRKKIVYFYNLPQSDTAKITTVETVKYEEPRILSNDLLAVTLQTIDQNSSNTPITTSVMGTYNPLNGFLVDKNGNIELSLIGFVHVGGLTTSEAREVIKEKAKEFYKEPVVNVRISNFDVNVLGDVGAPGVKTFPSEKVNILEAITLAGDLSLTGKRKNVLLIRTEGDTKKFVRFDLTSTDIFKSPYFYLRQHDFLYVEQSNYKIQSSDNTFTRTLGLITGAISFISLLLVFRSFK